MPIRFAICDDDAAQIEYLSREVSAWAEKVGESIKCSHFPSAEAFLFDYSENKDVDVLLLDIEMPGMNGMELARKLRGKKAALQIVFITGYSDFISEGYDVSALHYLMKPVSREKLFSVLDRAAANRAKEEKIIKITYDRETCFVPLSKIIFVEAQKQYISIHTEETVYRMKGSLSETEARLDEYFFRCQRSFLVNLRYVNRIKSDCVVLKNASEVPISRGMAEKIGKEIIRLF